MVYQRRSVEKAIVLALRYLGGSASRKQVKKTIADNEIDGLDYNQVYETKEGRKGTYIPFDLDFGFGIRNIVSVGYLEETQRGKDIVLTPLGMDDNLEGFPRLDQKEMISAYWNKKNAERAKRKKQQEEQEQIKSQQKNNDEDPIQNPNIDSEDTEESNWKAQLLNQLKKFTPEKFEQFSRLLISKMGVTIDKERGIVLSGDHGIDGFGYFTSDEFRTSRVAIQCKRFTTGAVSEPDIDRFKGVMDSFNAEYGIFVTTSYFTSQAKKKATQGSNTVTLIDGQQLADLVEKYQLHITPITTYTLDEYYFENGE